MFGVVIGFFMLDLVITRCSGADILTVENFPDTEKLDGQSQNRPRVRQRTPWFSKLFFQQKNDQLLTFNDSFRVVV